MTSNFSFLQGASHPEELVQSAAQIGYRAIAITDRNSLAGIVRAHRAAKEQELRYVVGTRIECSSLYSADLCYSLLCYPVNRNGYGNLCRLLTIGKRRTDKDNCLLAISDLIELQNDLLWVIVPPSSLNANDNNFSDFCSRFRAEMHATDALSLALTRSFAHYSQRLWQATHDLALKLSLPLVATNDVYYHTPTRRPLQDVLTCIRHKCCIEKAGFLLQQNAERHLKTPAEMLRLFREVPSAIRRTLEITERATFSLDELRYEYPNEICPSNTTPLTYLSNLTYHGAQERYPQGIPSKVTELLASELKLIAELHYERYFLTCYDIVLFASSRGILCQGRGAAANSAVCYCLGITAVDPSKIDLLFARFVSKEREEPPDIDIDFEHERREEVIQYLYQKYGRERAGLTCEVITYRQRSAIREVAKALGFSLSMVESLAKLIHRWTDCKLRAEDLQSLGLDPGDPTLRNALHLADELLGFPRHLSQHVGGFIICEKALCETVPILNASMPERTIIEWDKDDIEALGILKIDILALGMLTCIRKALDLLNPGRPAAEKLELYRIPHDDAQVYEMICRADTVGVFQIESRAQMSMLPRLKPRCFYDLVIEVAIVRPGPIQGNMVHPYLRRRNGIEKPSYPDARVEQVLGKTLGVPLFQEQAMRLAIVLAKFTPGEAEKLRRAMASWKRNLDVVAAFKEKIVRGMVENGYTPAFAESCMNQIRGFSEYGFPESHAASFANLVYASAWLKKHHPAHFAAALLNSQPMGFYAPAQIVRDAESHGVRILAIDINHSSWDSTLEGAAIRLGLRLIKGLNHEHAQTLSGLVAASGPFTTISSLWKRAQGSGVSKATLQTIARADAFSSMALARREALWEIRALPDKLLALDPFLSVTSPPTAFRPLNMQQAMFKDYETTGLSLKAHPLELIRAQLNTLKVCSALALKSPYRPAGAGAYVSVAGIAIVRQRPGSAKGVVFITLEDETGITNLIIRPHVFEQHSKIIMSSSSILAHGILERVESVIYVNVHKLESLDSIVLSGSAVNLPNRSYSY